jgi:hypothetical protein
MGTDRYRAIAAFAILASFLALAAPRLLARRAHKTQSASFPSASITEAPEIAPAAAHPLPPHEKVAALFGWAPAPKTVTEIIPPHEAKTADWMRPVGEVEKGDGLCWLFFKDERLGRVFRLRRDGKAENSAWLISENPESFTIAVDDETWTVPRRR